MGRPTRNNADYFSHDADASEDEKLMYLEAKFGLAGYALFFKILEKLTRSDNFEIRWNEIQATVMARQFGVELSLINEFIVAATTPQIAALLLENGTLSSPGLKKRLIPLLEKRQKEADRIAKKRTENAPEKDNSLKMGVVGATMPQSKDKVKKSILLEEEEVAREAEIENPIELAIQSLKADLERKEKARAAAPRRKLADMVEENPAIKNTYIVSRRLPPERFEEIVTAFDEEQAAAPTQHESDSHIVRHFLSFARSKIRIEKEDAQPRASAHRQQQDTRASSVPKNIPTYGP